ncbi:MAG: hypothetical protein K2X47_09875, partial [Bdellovibrionales bacterium]|nr:hypothetical protein [Bdellovibrionales bacterium]
PGKTGAFDDSGITLGSLVRFRDQKFLFYTGWNLTVSVPMNNSIGVAKFVSPDCLARFGDGPILTRALHEPYSCASPFVLFENGLFRMWYASMDNWKLEADGSHRHYYNLKYAESLDGLRWERNGIVAINYESASEYAFGRPFVLKENGVYKMWYAYRGESYRIGYAESSDGTQWKRKDKEMDFDVSDSGWDSGMVEYPCILDHKGTRYMFYNGNDYGKSGIGLAEMVT